MEEEDNSIVIFDTPENHVTTQLAAWPTVKFCFNRKVQDQTLR